MSFERTPESFCAGELAGIKVWVNRPGEAFGEADRYGYWVGSEQRIYVPPEGLASPDRVASHLVELAAAGGTVRLEQARQLVDAARSRAGF